MKRFYLNVINKELIEAVKDAERLLSPGSSMLEEIRLKNDFAFSSGTGEEIYQKIVTCGKIAPVFSYKPLWRFSTALGYSDNRGIHLNLYKLDKLDRASLVGLLCHEASHYLFGYSHGSNFPSKYKDNHSVPYFVSSNIKKWL